MYSKMKRIDYKKSIRFIIILCAMCNVQFTFSSLFSWAV